MLGLIGADERLMGTYRLKGVNKWIYWLMFGLIVGTGVASTVTPV